MNAYCELFIYQNCKILKNKNFKVDNISDYLSTLETLNKTDAQTNLPVAIQGQFMKHQLKLVYNIELKQTTLENVPVCGQDLLDYHEDYNYNYLCAINKDTNGNNVMAFRKVYYFITGKKWVGENSIQLELEMDVINSLIDNYGGSEEHLELSDKTMILRQHKDRWGKMSSEYTADDYYPKIDFYSENILPLLYKTKEVSLFDKIRDASGTYPDVYDEDSYYLVFRAQSTNENSPIDVLMCSDTQMVVSYGATGYSGDVSLSSILDRGYDTFIIYGNDSFNGHNNVGASITFDFTNEDGETESITLTINSTSEAIYWNDKIIAKGTLGTTSFTYSVRYRYRNLGNKHFKSAFINHIYCAKELYKGSTNVDTFEQYLGQDTLTNATILTDLQVSGTFVLSSISEIDRTDPLLLKIIKLPYRYASFRINTTTDIIERLPLGWAVKEISSVGTFLSYIDKDLTKCFSCSLTLESKDMTNVLSPLKYKNITYLPTTLKSDEFETKLLHSDFYLGRYIYDSYTYDLHYENYKFDGEISRDWPRNVRFYVSATMNSKFMFRFNYLDFAGGEEPFSADGYGNVIDFQNYTNVLYVARNNELPLFNSAYLNYIRTGYNYDVKTKNRQLASNIVGGVLSTAGAIVSAVGGGPLGMAGAVALGIGATQKFTSAIFQNAQAEQNIAQKLKTNEMQGLSVLGSDDVDLMSEYTNGNKLKFAIFEVSSKMRKCLFDLFYYCGYIANYRGIPETSSRIWFNFVQADAIFSNEQNFSQELVEELRKKYLDGITYLHKVSVPTTSGSVISWDFEQRYENYEIFMKHQYTIVDGIGEESVFTKPLSPAQNPEYGELISPNREMILRFRTPQGDLISEIRNIAKVEWDVHQVVQRLRFLGENSTILYQTTPSQYNPSNMIMTLIRTGVDYSISDDYQVVLNLLTKHIEVVED